LGGRVGERAGAVLRNRKRAGDRQITRPSRTQTTQDTPRRFPEKQLA
jgi:hypothetical protein